MPLSVALAGDARDVAVTLRYRHVNHAERWQTATAARGGTVAEAAIPGAYTDSPHPLQYYFELRLAGRAWLYPAFNATLSNQPYYAIVDRRPS